MLLIHIDPDDEAGVTVREERGDTHLSDYPVPVECLHEIGVIGFDIDRLEFLQSLCRERNLGGISTSELFAVCELLDIPTHLI